MLYDFPSCQVRRKCLLFPARPRPLQGVWLDDIPRSLQQSTPVAKSVGTCDLGKQRVAHLGCSLEITAECFGEMNSLQGSRQ